MKRLLILILLFSIGSSVNAQDPDPDLFQTWYVYYFEDDAFMVEVSQINPPISPHITITENLDFLGEGACNSFNGTYSSPYPGGLEAIQFNETGNDCGFQNHNIFESHYFGLIGTGSDYEITQDGGGHILELSTPLMVYAEFRSYPLSSSDFNLDVIKIYPNPSTSEIFIESKRDPITKTELFNLLGERVQSLSDNTDSIDISDLASGIYLLRIFTAQGSTVKKIIKQ